MRNHRKVVLFAAAAAVSLGSSKVQADTYQWEGDGINGNWSTLANWGAFSSSTPQPGDQVNFNDPESIRGTSNVNTSRSVGGILVNGASDEGDYIFTGSNTTLTVTGVFLVYGSDSDPAFPTISSGLTVDTDSLFVRPTSLLSISGGGSVVTGDLEMAIAGTTPALAILNQGALTLTSTAQISNGTLELDAGGQLNMSSGGALGTVLTASTSTGQISLLTSWAVPNNATVQALSGADITSNSAFDVGSGTSGTMTIDGSGSSVTAGGTAASNWSTIGGSATITLSNSATGNYKTGLRIGNAGGGTAHVNISSGAQLSVDYGLYVGGSATASAATITLNSATLGIGSHGFALFDPGSTFNFQSGTVALANNATFSTGSTFNWSGGTITGSGNTIGIAGGVASLTFGGLITNGNTLSVTNGGHLDSNSYLYMGSTFSSGGSGSAGTLNVSDAGSHVAFSALSVCGYGTGAAASITFANSAVGTFSNSLWVGDLGGAATVNLNSKAVLNVGPYFQAGYTSAGSAATITLASGTLNSTGTTEFLSGTHLTADAFSELNFGDNATFSTGSSVNLSGTVLSLPSGKTLTIDGGAVTDTRNGLIGSGETYIIQNGGHWDAVEDDLEGGTLLVTGTGSRFTGSGTQSAEWDGPGLNVTFANSGIGTFAGGVFLGGGADIDQLNVTTLSTLQFGSLTTFENDTENGVTGATTISIDRTSALTVTGNATFTNGAVVNETGGLTFDGNATFTTGSTLHASGLYSLNTGSQTTLAFAGGVGTFTNAFSLPGGNTLSVTNGGQVSDSVEFDVANGQATGTLLVDGTNSSISSNNILFRGQWGMNSGNSATITFSHNAVGTFMPGLLISNNGGASSISILSGAKVTAGDLTMGGSSNSMLTINGGTLNVTGGATFNGGSGVLLQSGSLTVGGQLTLLGPMFLDDSSQLIKAGGLSITGASFLNLESGKMIVANTALSQIKTYLSTGYANGLWNGTAIFSSSAETFPASRTALGYASAGSIGLGSFAGQSVNPTDTLITYTYYGDANLDGTVNALDFNALATNYGKTPGSDVWTQGDFNYDGTVNSSDFALLAANYGQVLPTAADMPDATTPLGTSVPEPTSLAALFGLSLLPRFRFRFRRRV